MLPMTLIVPAPIPAPLTVPLGLASLACVVGLLLIAGVALVISAARGRGERRDLHGPTVTMLPRTPRRPRRLAA